MCSSVLIVGAKFQGLSKGFSMDEKLFRVVVSQFIFHVRISRDWLRGAHIEQHTLARGLGVRDATVSSWVNKDSGISAYMLFRLFFLVSELRGCKVSEVLEYFFEIYERVSRGRSDYGCS